MTAAATTDGKSEREHLWSLIKDQEIAMLTTRGEGDALHARPMATVRRDFDGALFFLTKEGSPKLKEAVRHPEVNVAYCDARSNIYVSVSGAARVIESRDQIRESWVESARLWFPNGPEESDIRLLIVDVETAEYWKGPSMARYAYNYAKTRLTGRRPSQDPLGENSVVKF